MILTKPQTKKLIKESLTPKYNEGRDAKIAYLVELKAKIKKAHSDIREVRQSLHKGEITQDEAKEQINSHRGIYSVASQKDLGTASDYSDTQIKERTTKAFNESLLALIEKIYSEIKTLSPKAITLIEVSDYDIELLLTLKDGNRSYTINTIVAGGYNIQCLHYRTTYKLHKGVIS